MWIDEWVVTETCAFEESKRALWVMLSLRQYQATLSDQKTTHFIHN